MTSKQEQGTSARQPLVQIHGLQKSYDGKQFVVQDLNLTIERGEFLTLLGPSGSGKTTMLMMLAGFEMPTAGSILYNARSIERLPPHQRNFGVVFQSYALFPHMSVFDNVAFPLSVRKVAERDIAKRVERALSMVRLNEFGERRPAQLSGGQQQRVALARALVFEPELVLMDEPLGALDKNLREQLQFEIKQLHRQLGVTVIYVTHDQVEAMVMSDRIAIFNRGRIEQIDTPRMVHEQPDTAFVASFMGEMNLFEGTVVAAQHHGQATVRLASGSLFHGVSARPQEVGATCLVAVRPERIQLNPETSSCDNFMRGTITESIYLGDRMAIRVTVEDGLKLLINGGIGSLDAPGMVGAPLAVGWNREHCLILDRG